MIIAASGSWERGPVPVRLRRAHRAADLLAFKGHFLDCDLPDDLMPLLVFPGGYGGMVHSASGGVNVSSCIRRDVLTEARGRGAARAWEAVLRHIQASSAAVRWMMRGARLDGAWLAAGPINPGIRKSQAEGIFLVGNLAGEAHPLVAEGISMAIQSAWLLSRLLISRQEVLPRQCTLTEIRMEYNAEWQKRFAGRLRASDWFARIAMSPLGVAAVLPLLDRFPALLTLGAQLSGKAQRVHAVS